MLFSGGEVFVSLSVLSQKVRERLDSELPWIVFTHLGVAQAVLEEGLSSTPGNI